MPNPSSVQLMARLRGLLLYYRLFFLIPGLLLTLVGSVLYYRNARYDFNITPAILSLKILALGMTAWTASRRKERYYFFNLGISNTLLIGSACIIDILLFAIVLQITIKLL